MGWFSWMEEVEEYPLSEEEMATTTFSKKCVFCGKVHIFSEDAEKVARWRGGEYIQQVFSEKSADERELMISGTCPECRDKHMKLPDEE